MIALLLALTLQAQTPQAVVRELGTRWHPTVAIETGLKELAFVAIFPPASNSSAHFFAVDSSGSIVEMAFEDRAWTIVARTSVGERIVTGCAAAMRADETWSLIVGTVSGKIIEMRQGEMGWGRHEVATAPTPLRALRASAPGFPGPSQLFVIDGNGDVTNWYVGASGRWIAKALPTTNGGATHVCFDYPRDGLTAITAGPKGIIHKFVQDSMGDWGGSAWDTVAAGCLDLAASIDPTKKDICFFYSGTDGHLRYMFFGRQEDVSSRIPCAGGSYRLIGKGDQRRYNEFFGMSGNEFCIFEYDPALKEWVKVPIIPIPGKVVSTDFGIARGMPWCTMYAATIDGRIYEFERDGLENE